jgi:hypothetical protein
MTKKKYETLQKLKQNLIFKDFSSKTIKFYLNNLKIFLNYLDKSSQKIL